MQISRVEWRTAALYIMSGLAPCEVARLLGCAPQDVEALLALPEFQALLEDGLVVRLPAADARRAGVAAVVRGLSSPDTPTSPRSDTGPCPAADRLDVSRARPRQLPYSFVPEAAAYLRQVAPDASVRLIR